jgi:hypothetical protein
VENKAKRCDKTGPRRGDSFVLEGMPMDSRATGQSLVGSRDAVNKQSKSGGCLGT